MIELSTAATLALSRIGISHSRIKSMFWVIQKMVHMIKTVYDVSDVKYGGDELDAWENCPRVCYKAMLQAQ